MRKRYYFYLAAILCFGCAALLVCTEGKFIFAYKEIYIFDKSYLKYSSEYAKGMKILKKLNRFGIKLNGKWLPELFSNHKKKEKALNYILQDIEEKGFPEDVSETISIIAAVSNLSSELERREEKRAFYLQVVEHFPEDSPQNRFAQRLLDVMPESESTSSPTHRRGEILHMYFRAIVRELFVVLCVMGGIAPLIAVRRLRLERERGLAISDDEIAGKAETSS